jgi:hypothetical protein
LQGCLPSIVPLDSHAAGKDVKKVVDNFRCPPLFRDSGAAYFGEHLERVMHHPLPDVMPVVNTNLARLFPEHVKGAWFRV